MEWRRSEKKAVIGAGKCRRDGLMQGHEIESQGEFTEIESSFPHSTMWTANKGNNTRTMNIIELVSRMQGRFQ